MADTQPRNGSRSARSIQMATGRSRIEPRTDRSRVAWTNPRYPRGVVSSDIDPSNFGPQSCTWVATPTRTCACQIRSSGRFRTEGTLQRSSSKIEARVTTLPIGSESSTPSFLDRTAQGPHRGPGWGCISRGGIVAAHGGSMPAGMADRRSAFRVELPLEMNGRQTSAS